MDTVTRTSNGINNQSLNGKARVDGANRVNGKLADPAAIRQFLDRVIEPGQVTELRVFGATSPRGRTNVTVVGYFDDLDLLTEAATRAAPTAPAVYIIPNPVNPALLARAANRAKECGPKDPATSDSDIIARHWLLIDADPVRPSGISSSDSEHEAAIALVWKIRDYLTSLGWPTPIVADSGNGGHLMYHVDLPATDEGLIERDLKALASRFDGSTVKVDTGVFNPARIWKLYGTPARKGDSTPDRPHRLSKVLEMPESLEIVSRDLLEALAASGPTDAPRASGKTSTASSGKTIPWTDGFDLEAWVRKYLPNAKGPNPWQGTGIRYELEECPWDSNHKESAFVAQLPAGPLTAGCLHNSCRDKSWDDLRALFDPEGAERAKKAREREASSAGPKAKESSSDSPSTAEPSNFWEAPAPFFQADAPAFPTDALPEHLRAYVEAEATATQTPADLAAMVGLAVLGVACQRNIRMKVRDGWSEPVNVYTVTALPSGSRKSTVLHDMAEPLEAFERSESEKQAPEIAKAESLHKTAKARLENLQTQAAKAKDAIDAERYAEEAAEAAVELAGTVIPAMPRLLADDVTPEKLSSLIAQHGGKMAVLSPEGDLFDLMTARYGNAPNFGVFLRAHAGDTLRIDRIGRAPEFVEAPALTLGLAVQPDVLRGLVQTPSLRGRGMLARYLYSWPPSLLGQREIEPDTVPYDVMAEYSASVIALLRLKPDTDPNGDEIPHLLKFSQSGYAAFRAFLVWIEPQLSETGELGSMSDWAGKLAGHVARIASLLHMAEHARRSEPWALEISETTVRNAIRIGNYLIAHARVTFAEMGADPEVENARYVLRWIEREGRTSFTKRDTYQGTKGRFKKVESLDPVLKLLDSHGYIRERESGEPRKPGRQPSPIFDVNPRIAICGNSGNCGNTEEGLYAQKEAPMHSVNVNKLSQNVFPGIYSHNSHNSHNSINDAVTELGDLEGGEL